MKNKIAIASAFLAASSFSTAEIVINDFLSFEGFVDMSYSHADDDSSVGSESTNSYTVDQVEISWLFDFNPVTARLDLELDEGFENANLDQAFVSYDLGNGSAITAGRYDSMLGFEAFEPTGLYQYSTAYSSDTEFLADAGVSISDIILPSTNEGVKYTYESDTVFFGISLQDGAFNGDDRLGGDNDTTGFLGFIADLLLEAEVITEDDVSDFLGVSSGYAVEVASAFDFGNGFTGFIGAAYEDMSDDGDIFVINAYGTYETGAWLFAAEYNNTDWDLIGTDLEIDSALVMANYSYSDQASVTGRVSYIDINDLADGVKYTVAHNYAFTDNLLLVTELSRVDYDYESGEDGNTLEAAVELIFSF